MHDRNGTPLRVGDIVTVRAQIMSCTGDVDYCNVTLAVGFDAEHGPANVKNSLALNTRQVVLAERAPE